MGTLQRREREKTEFREEVLKAAREIVLKEGFDALSMRKIADAIEYSPGTIYLYFESRDAIAHDLCVQGFEALLAAMAPAASIAEPRERLAALGKRYIEFGLQNPETYRLIFMEDPKFTTPMFEDGEHDDSPGGQALGFLVAAFDELRAQKRLKSKADSAQLAEMLWASVHGIVSLKLTCLEFPQTPTETLADLMSKALLDGLIAQ